ncbi:YczI family protein [Pseudalkalibacillus sp. Hm43]
MSLHLIEVEKLLKWLQISLGIIVLSLSVYGLLSGNYAFNFYMFLFAGLMLFVGGLNELKEKRKLTAMFSFLTSAFVIYVSIYTY